MTSVHVRYLVYRLQVVSLSDVKKKGEIHLCMCALFKYMFIYVNGHLNLIGASLGKIQAQNPTMHVIT